SARGVLDTLFSRAKEAVDTLADPARRSEYDLLLGRQKAGLPTDATAVLEAEACQRRGESLVKANRPSEAVLAFQDALAKNPEAPQVHAWLGYALHLARGPEAAGEARAHLRQALEQAPALAEAYCFLGILARDEDDTDEAAALFE